MAAVKEITADIKETFGSSFINASQAGRYLGMGKEKRGAFLADLPCYPTGKEKKYHALDIARRMDALKTYNPFG
jgi:hypothetical protein